MKKHARKWAILLMLTLIFSFEGLAVFANTDNEQGTDVVGDSELEAVQSESKAATATKISVDAKYDQSAAKFTITWSADGDVDGAFTLTIEKGGNEVFNEEMPEGTSSYTYNAAADGSTYRFTVSAGELSETKEAIATKPAAPAPAVKGLGAFAGAAQTSNPEAGFVTLYWHADPNSVKYEIYVDGNYAGTVTNSHQRNTPPSSGAKGAKRVYYNATNLNEYKKHSFKVVAYNKEGDTAYATASKWAVRPMNYVMRMKGRVTLKSHAGKSRSLTLAKNAQVRAYGFASGKYVFKKNGSIYYLARTRGKGIYADYARSFNYSRADAENYVNMANIGSSSKKRLIWVSTYCQHVYYFTGSKGNWKCVKDWECSTGAARSPSPSGMWGNKEIHKFIKNRHGLRYWSCYSSMNAFHGKQSSWKMGRPASSGCIRNANGNAEYLYKHTMKRTKVIVN